MPKIIYIDHQNNQYEADVPTDWSVMEGAVNNGIDGIVAECGGGCACATCHVFVAPEWYAKLPPADEMENDMLACTVTESTEHSRLSCQIKVTEALDGLIVHLPARQI